MPNKNPEIYFVIIIGATLALLLVGFIVTILFLYQRRRHQQEQELAQMKDLYEQEALKSQLEIQENTLKNISQELHDNIGQMLSVVKMSLAVLPVQKEHEAFEPIQNSRQILNKAIVDLSNLTKSLHTDRITEIGLAEAIRYELEAVKKSGILQVEFSVTGEEFHFDDQKKIFLFRMFQENLNNIIKHSQATAVKTSLNYSGDNTFVMHIEDNGIGFNVEEKRKSVSSSSGVGLKSLFNRAALVGAELSMESEPGKGTRVTIELAAPETN
jgi:two-component system, NarL family, sensor kinase